MIRIGALATHGRLWSAALMSAAAAAVVLTSGGSPGSQGTPPAGLATMSGAAAVTAPAPVPARHASDAPAHAIRSLGANRHGVILYFLMEAAQPQPMFAH